MAWCQWRHWVSILFFLLGMAVICLQHAIRRPDYGPRMHSWRAEAFYTKYILLTAGEKRCYTLHCSDTVHLHWTPGHLDTWTPATSFRHATRPTFSNSCRLVIAIGYMPLGCRRHRRCWREKGNSCSDGRMSVPMAPLPCQC